MSNFTGVTFSKQRITPSDDAIIRRAMLPDGKLTGCEISYSGSTLTMSPGHLIACGRQFRHPATQNWAVTDATSGFARLVLTIDLTKEATKEAFKQIDTAIEYASARDGFVDLDQSDINASGIRYQIVLCVVSLGTGGITGIVEQLEQSEVGGVNFKVVGGLTQPANPKENTFWVNTDVSIPMWVVGSTAPEAPTEGMVWISNGSASRVVINVLKKNALYIYPQVARQCVSGVWVNRDSYCYQNKAWTPLWFGQLYTPGDEWTAVTGGWTSVAMKSFKNSGASAKAPTITRGTSSIKAQTSGGGVFHTVNKIDVTEFDSLTFRGEFARGGSSGRNLLAACWENFGSYYDEGDGASAASAGLSGSAGKELTVDVSGLSGEYFLGLGLTESTAIVEEIILSTQQSSDEAELLSWNLSEDVTSFAKGATVAHNGKIWVSDVESNKSEPGTDGWKEVTV